MSGPCVLALGGLDPSGGAGLLADAEAIRARGARPLCVPTALTVQTTLRARGHTPVDTAWLLEAARALLEEEDVRAIKLGMLGTLPVARAVTGLVAEAVAARPGLWVVVDPVLFSSSGAPLLDATDEEARIAYAALAEFAVITPNAPEAQILLGWKEPPTHQASLEQAARELLELGARAALVKGGHASGPRSVDVLLKQGGQPVPLAAERLRKEARGTGCRLASALAAGLARGQELSWAARGAKQWVLEYLQQA